MGDSEVWVFLHWYDPTHRNKPFALIASIQAWNNSRAEPQARRCGNQTSNWERGKEVSRSPRGVFNITCNYVYPQSQLKKQSTFIYSCWRDLGLKGAFPYHRGKYEGGGGDSHAAGLWNSSLKCNHDFRNAATFACASWLCRKQTGTVRSSGSRLLQHLRKDMLLHTNHPGSGWRKWNPPDLYHRSFLCSASTCAATKQT